MRFNGNLRYQVLYKATGGREARFGCFRQYLQTWGFKNGHWQDWLIGILRLLLRCEWTLRITHLKQIIWKGTRKGLTHVGHHHLALTFKKKKCICFISPPHLPNGKGVGDTVNDLWCFPFFAAKFGGINWYIVACSACLLTTHHRHNDRWKHRTFSVLSHCPNFAEQLAIHQIHAHLAVENVIHTAFSMDFSTGFSRGTQLAKSTPQGRLWRPMMWIFFNISFSSLLQPMAIIIYPSGAIAPLKRGRTWRNALWIPTGNKFWSLCAKRSCRSFGTILTDLGRLLLGLFAWEMMPKWGKVCQVFIWKIVKWRMISRICICLKSEGSNKIRQIELLLGFSMVDSVTNWWQLLSFLINSSQSFTT